MQAMDDLLAAALGQVSVLDDRSAAVRLGDFWAKRPVVLALVRHLGCLFCRQQVAGLMRRLPEIERRSASPVVVGPSRPEHIASCSRAVRVPARPESPSPALSATLADDRVICRARSRSCRATFFAIACSRATIVTTSSRTRSVMWVSFCSVGLRQPEGWGAEVESRLRSTARSAAWP